METVLYPSLFYRFIGLCENEQNDYMKKEIG